MVKNYTGSNGIAQFVVYSTRWTKHAKDAYRL